LPRSRDPAICRPGTAKRVPHNPGSSDRARTAAVTHATYSNDKPSLGGSGVDEHGIVEFRVVSPDQQSSQRWVDPRLEFPVKLRAADGTTIALERIRVEAQPASLFVVPAGYRKFTPQAPIDRIKRSDVWVDPSHAYQPNPTQ
jgi:hypothetical protein